MIGWMAYAALLGLGLWGAAEGVVRVGRSRGWPERWVWAGALAAAVLFPVVLPFLPRASGVAVGTVTLPGLEVGAGGGPAAAGRAAALPAALLPLLLWGAATAGLALRLAWAHRAVRHLVRSGRPLRRRPVELRLTGGAGPAVAGALRPVILLPDDFPDLPRGARRWVLRHEFEHVRAGDPGLMWAVRLVEVLLPWNPALWLLGRRLREGVELDCDRRLLRRRPDPRGYGEALLTLSAPGPARPLPVAAFREPYLSLKRRILAMTTPTRPPSRPVLGALTAAAALVLAGACEVSPTFQDQGTDEPAPTPPTAEATAKTTLADGPTFTPYTAAPAMLNRDEVVKALEDGYPPLLREAGIGGTTNVWFFLGEDGAILDLRVRESSGHEALDEAALAVASTMKFAPARNGDEAVPVWVAFPITFQAR
ncbi:MAG: M56 family metallopeptidase [Longimicrobiales bacterium]|nr:M56 family metallopeptidase [Longimicrobiales bacterium]